MKQFLVQIYKRKWLLVLLLFIKIMVAIYVFRVPLLRLTGNILIKQDALKTCDAIFVLSGNATDRAPEAALLYKQGIAKKIICTGGNQTGDFKILGLKELESDMIRLRLLQLNIPDSAIVVIHQGTSTFEESQVIKLYCEKNKIKLATIVSSAFHTRRIYSVFGKAFLNSATKIMVHASPSQSYNIDEWWKNEYGLLAVYDEYIKLGYYALKH
ncbi:MAG: hypothetical protein RJA07_1500 [Bacteroidota bacterium]|jgi:uncharacterized SAM-binding protein YcdF (DUF218 family)